MEILGAIMIVLALAGLVVLNHLNKQVLSFRTMCAATVMEKVAEHGNGPRHAFKEFLGAVYEGGRTAAVRRRGHFHDVVRTVRLNSERPYSFIKMA